MIDIETYLTIFKEGDIINIDELGNKSTIYGVSFTQDQKTKWLKNTKPYYLRKVELKIRPVTRDIDDIWIRMISLDRVIDLNNDKVRDYKLGRLLD